MTTFHDNAPSNECERCDGTGTRWPRGGGEAYTCPKCRGKGWTGQPISDAQRFERAEIENVELRQQLAEATAAANREVAAMLLNGEMSPGEIALNLMKQAKK